MPIRQSHLEWTNNIALGITTTVWFGQTFQVSVPCSINKIRLFGKRVISSGTPGDITVSIYLCDSSHKPTGSALTTGTVNGNSLDYVTGQTFDAAVTSYTLLPDVEYAIVASCEGTNINNSVYLKRDSLAGYSNGSMVASADSGDSWTVDTTNDLYFAVAEDDFTGTRVSKAMQRVSQEVGGYLSGTTDASGGSSGETLKCGALAEYEDDELINRYVYVRSGSAIGDERIIGDFAQTDGVVTPRRAFTAQVASGHRFEIHPFPPSRIIEKLNWATQRTQYLYRTIKD
jgi:hypothetical protein